ncbi:hypothetical protein C0993_005990 [Termitomyces sp. T159_Od127]|nr:hypothetical protein C0993_005990 [Termitomyces sp. T159_Od127]
MGYSSSLKSMQEFVDAQRKQPRVTEWNRQTVVQSPSEEFSVIKKVQKKRETKVKQALYGLDEKDGNVPGLEILKDAAAYEKDLLKRLESDAVELFKDEK